MAKQTLEKNDVDIKKLFTWGKDVELKFGDKEIKFYIKIVGDSEVNRARVQALRASGDLRRKLKDLNSDERLAYVVDKESISKAQIIDILLQGYYTQMLGEAGKLVTVEGPEELTEGANLEQQEQYQKDLDEYPTKYEEAIREEVSKIYDREYKRIELIEFDDIYNSYVVTVINNMCEAEMIKIFRELCTYYGSYKDSNCKERLFSTVDEFNNLPAAVKEEFVKVYGTLDLNMEDLKK
jgi:hypothetical protein